MAYSQYPLVQGISMGQQRDMYNKSRKDNSMRNLLNMAQLFMQMKQGKEQFGEQQAFKQQELGLEKADLEARKGYYQTQQDLVSRDPEKIRTYDAAIKRGMSPEQATKLASQGGTVYWQTEEGRKDRETQRSVSAENRNLKLWEIDYNKFNTTISRYNGHAQSIYEEIALLEKELEADTEYQAYLGDKHAIDQKWESGKYTGDKASRKRKRNIIPAKAKRNLDAIASYEKQLESMSAAKEELSKVQNRLDTNRVPLDKEDMRKLNIYNARYRAIAEGTFAPPSFSFSEGSGGNVGELSAEELIAKEAQDRGISIEQARAELMEEYKKLP